jgi:hypothetical protein
MFGKQASLRKEQLYHLQLEKRISSCRWRRKEAQPTLETHRGRSLVALQLIFPAIGILDEHPALDLNQQSPRIGSWRENNRQLG